MFSLWLLSITVFNAGRVFVARGLTFLSDVASGKALLGPSGVSVMLEDG